MPCSWQAASRSRANGGPRTRRPAADLGERRERESGRLDLDTVLGKPSGGGSQKLAGHPHGGRVHQEAAAQADRSNLHGALVVAAGLQSGPTDPRKGTPFLLLDGGTAHVQPPRAHISDRIETRGSCRSAVDCDQTPDDAKEHQTCSCQRPPTARPSTTRSEACPAGRPPPVRYREAEQRFSTALQRRLDELLRGERNRLMLLRKYPSEPHRIGVMNTRVDTSSLRVRIVERLIRDALLFLHADPHGGPCAQVHDGDGGLGRDPQVHHQVPAHRHRADRRLRRGDRRDAAHPVVGDADAEPARRHPHQPDARRGKPRTGRGQAVHLT